MEERLDEELKIDKRRKSPNHGNRGNQKPDVIVLHVSEGYYDSGIDWLCSPKAQASTHFFVAKDGRCAQLVDIEKSAWGNATTYKVSTDKRYYKKSKKKLINTRPMSANRYTVSIEFEGFYKDGGSLTEQQHKTAIDLLIHIRKQVKKLYNYDIPMDNEHVMSHSALVPQWKPYCGKNIDIEKLLLDVQKKIK
jgi:N-acetyl-anhydromuramyl-L-alanine amidase AmpD